MRHLLAVAAASTLLATSAFADSVSSLAPGKPAGVHAAQTDDNTVWYIVGLGAIGAGIALVATGNNDNGGSSGTGASGGGGGVATTTTSR